MPTSIIDQLTPNWSRVKVEWDMQQQIHQRLSHDTYPKTKKKPFDGKTEEGEYEGE